MAQIAVRKQTIGERSADLVALATLLGSSLITVLLLVYFHDRFWFPRDDGYYAHIADRILNGKLLHRDVQALHPGGVYYLNALAMELFGRSFIALRYPLIGAGLAQTALVFLIFRPKGIVIAGVATVVCTSLTIIQFFSPTAHWYCLPLFFAIVLLLRPENRELRWRLQAIGVLLVLMFWLRQLTAVFTAIGVLTFLLIEPQQITEKRPTLARALMILMALAICLYLASKTDPIGWLMFGAWPVLLIAWSTLRLTIDDRATVALISRLAQGGAAAAAPVFCYYLWSGTFPDWFRDVFLDAIALGEFDYQKTGRYVLFLANSVSNLKDISKPASVLNAVYWLIMISATAVLAITTLPKLLPDQFRRQAIEPLPFLAVFYGLVATHYQDPAYLYFIAGPVSAGLLWNLSAAPTAARSLGIIGAGLVAVIALYFHAGQPISRTYEEVNTGQRIHLVKSALPSLDGLHITASDEETYTTLLAVIGQYSKPEEPILAVPAEAELFFMANRSNPLRYSFLPFGIREDDTVTETLRVLEKARPQVVFHVPSLPYNSLHTDRIMDWVRSNYEHVLTVREFRVYLPMNTQ